MHRLPPSVRRFFDLEAHNDDDDEERNGEEEEEEEEQALRNNFIDDTTRPSTNQLDRPHTTWNNIINYNDDEEIFGNLLKRAHERSDTHHPGIAALIENEDNHSTIRARPSADDYPLWRIKCRMGLEEEAVFYLLQRAEEKHQLRSAFTRGSIRGWIYLEANFNNNLLQLLKLTPGVISSRQGVLRHFIDPSDWLNMLTMYDPRTVFQVGNWVRVGRGKYKGDVGFVVQVESFVEILLVPRLNPPTAIDTSKRKRTTVRSKPELVDPDTIKEIYEVDPRHGPGEEVFTALGLQFQYGLVQKAYNFHSVSSTAVIPSSLFSSFLFSGHPLVVSSEFPKPQEWIFEEGESVNIRSSGERATVIAIEPRHLEVCRSNGSGNTAVPWNDVRKAIQIGDFVEVTSGSLIGVAGWVDCVDEEVVSVVEKVAGTTSPDTVKRFEAHINWVKVTSAPFLHTLAAPHSNVEPSRANRIPWIGTTVILTKYGHPWKGYDTVVKNVLARQPTVSGLKVEIQLSHLNFASPFKTAIVDYDDIIEKTTGKQLFDFSRPVDMLFHPPRHYRSRQFLPPLQASQPSISSPLAPGGATPMPDCSTSLSPAWNPSSRTPGWEPSFDAPTATLPSPISPPIASTSRVAAVQEPPQHPLLNPLLVGVSLKANITEKDGKVKEQNISIVENNGWPRLIRTVYTTAVSLVPDRVSVKHPNATRDNGLLVIIQGEHTGKYVRRIHHKYSDGRASMILAVVRPVDGAADTLVEERLELDVDLLCVAAETKKQKDLNSLLRSQLRSEAQKL